MAHTFLVADELEYGMMLQHVKDDDAKGLVDEALTTGAILEVKGGVELLPEKEAYTPYPGLDAGLWMVVQAKLDTSRTTALAVSRDSFLTHRLESLDAGKLPVNATFNVLGRLVGTMAGTHGSPGGQVVIRLASDEFIAFTCHDDALLEEAQDHWNSWGGRPDREREWQWSCSAARAGRRGVRDRPRCTLDGLLAHGSPPLRARDARRREPCPFECSGVAQVRWLWCEVCRLGCCGQCAGQATASRTY